MYIPNMEPIETIKNMTLHEKQIYMQNAIPYRITDGLFSWLNDVGYYTAPASMKHHGSEEGSLFIHSARVAEYLWHISKALNYEWERPQSPFIIGILHDVCKVDAYNKIVDEGKDKKDTKEAAGYHYEWNREQIYPGHGEKSLIMIMNYIKLTEEEKLCIRYHMGAFTDQKEWEYYSRAVKRCSGVLLTHMADMMASQVDGV